MEEYHIYGPVINAIRIILEREDPWEKADFIEDRETRTAYIALHVIINSAVSGNKRVFGKRICDNGIECVYFKVYALLRSVCKEILDRGLDNSSHPFYEGIFETTGCTFYHDRSTTFDYNGDKSKRELQSFYESISEDYNSLLNVICMLEDQVISFNEAYGDEIPCDKTFFKNPVPTTVVEHMSISHDKMQSSIESLVTGGLSKEEAKRIGKTINK